MKAWEGNMQDIEKNISLRELYRVLNETLIGREKNALFVDSIILPLSVGIVTFAIKERSNFGIGIFDLPVAGFIPILTLFLVLFPFALHIQTARLMTFTLTTYTKSKKNCRFRIMVIKASITISQMQDGTG